MSWLLQLFQQDSVAHAMLIISLVVSSGLVVGRLAVAGIRLGIAGVLFSGLVFGHFGLTVNAEVMHFLREFGLILFVYAIGLQVGPGFVGSFFQQGLRLNLMAGAIVLLGALLALAIGKWGHIPMPVAAGLFAGATTNTPSLAAAQQVLAGLPGFDAESAKLPGLGYAVAYPFGIIGIILSMLLVKRLFKIDIGNEADDYARYQPTGSQLVWQDWVVENPNLQGKAIADISFFQSLHVIVTRILHSGAEEVKIATGATRLGLGDVIRLVGEPEQLQRLQLLIGPHASVNLQEITQNLRSARLSVTNRAAINQTIGDLCLRYGVTISRVHRPDVEFTPSASLPVHFGDELLVVGSDEALTDIERALGNSLEVLSHPQIMPIFIGITLGVLLGSWPFSLPGVPTELTLGMAGGPLLVAILLSRTANWGTMSWQLPKSSNMVLKDIGIVLFLACVGLHSGDEFVDTLLKGDGWYWMACASLITLLPLLCVALLARVLYRQNYLSLCGLLAGSMTDPPALAFANNLHPSAAVSIAYATVYPLVMILRIVAAQLLVLVE